MENENKVEQKKQDNQIFVGELYEPSNGEVRGRSKIGNYYRAITAVLGKGHKEAILKTRGKHIKNAVDILEYAKRTSMGLLENGEIKTATSVYKGEDGKERYCSELEIPIRKK